MTLRFKHLGRRGRTLLGEIAAEIGQAQLPMAASSLAYTTILSLVPLLAVSLSIFKLFGGLQRLYGTLEPLIIQNLAEGVDEQAVAAIRGFIANIDAGALGLGGTIGLVLTSMALLYSAERAINRVWRAPLTRPFFYRVASYWFFVTLGPLAAAVLIGTVTSADQNVFDYVPSGIWLFASSAALFTLVHKFVPHRRVHWVPAAAAGTVTAAFWNLASAGYIVYTRHLVSYDRIYGSLGAIPILLLWIYIIWLIILGGAAVAVVLQRRFNFHS